MTCAKLWADQKVILTRLLARFGQWAQMLFVKWFTNGLSAWTVNPISLNNVLMDRCMVLIIITLQNGLFATNSDTRWLDPTQALRKKMIFQTFIWNQNYTIWMIVPRVRQSKWTHDILFVVNQCLRLVGIKLSCNQPSFVCNSSIIVTS